MISFNKRIIAMLLALIMVVSMGPVQAFASEDSTVVTEPQEAIVTLSEGEPSISDYQTFIMYLYNLEGLASMYVLDHPGKDPAALVIKYIRTGVDRYNSGSWGIMAGYEDADFANFIQQVQDSFNASVETEEEKMYITALKNLEVMELPNGEQSDLGHVFGTMDITYHNKFGQNHADVGGWTGDLVDLLSFSDYGNVSGTLEQMVAEISENYLLETAPSDVGGMNQLDFRGDLDALYIMNTLQKQGYSFAMDGELSGFSAMLSTYFTAELDDVQRADYFLRNRLGGVSTQIDIRDAVYSAYLGNSVVTTLEATRDFNASDLSELRKAVCYAFADYVCKLAGDYVENTKNNQYTVFSSEASTLAPGITQKVNMATTSDGNRIVYYVATADITRDDVHVYANYNNNDPSQGWEMQRVLDQANAAQEKYGNPESEHYIENYNVIVSVNGAGFNMQTGEPGGVLVMGGVEYHAPNANGFFGILKDGSAVIGSTEEYNTIYKGKVQEAIAGFGARLIVDGKVVPGLDNSRASRTCVGITKSGKVVMVVLDGRQGAFSAGGGYADLAQILLDAGCYQGVNLDGGGSTTYVARQVGDEELSVVNSPSDGFQRSVATSLMMVSTAPSSTAFDHAELETATDYMTIGSSVQVTPIGISPTGNPVDLPEGTTWAVSDTRWGSITEDGVFTALRNGAVDVYLMLGDAIIGTKTMNVVVPNGIYFTRTSMDTVYGATVELPVKVLYDGKEVAINANDVNFALSNAKAGTMDGFSFVCSTNEDSGVKSVQINASLAADSSTMATITISLYKQGELSFDFDQATGGDRMLAWYREVSNSVTTDDINYSVLDANEQMVTSYTLAIDMTQIPIPPRLEELTYMLPGSDIAGASAWTFLLQLAQRISDLTEITATIQFDSDMDVDISELKVINDLFVLQSSELDPETNELTLVLKWKKQQAAIDPDTANSLCMVNGLKMTPKADADWGSKNRLSVIHTGDVRYKIYMRASALYSFAQKPENQEIFGLYDYANPNDAEDKGGYFQDTYTSFEDSYNLINVIKSGWYTEEGGFAYYVEGEKLTGIAQAEGLYYNFGENGINTGKTPYSGLLQLSGKTYYATLGKLTSGWQVIGQDYYYFNTNTFAAHTGVSTVGGVQYTFDANGVLVKGAFVETSKGTRYYWGGRFMERAWIELEDGIRYANDNGYIVYGNYPVIENSTEDPIWWHFDETTGIVTGICDGFVQMNGQTYYCEDGVWYYGAVRTDNGIVFCGTNGKVVINNSCYIGDSLETKAGLENGYYWCDENGYIVANGFVTVKENTYYFTDYVRAKGFTKVGEDYYFFNAGNGKMMTDTTLWVSGSNPYGIVAGYYYFQADGTMYEPDPNGEKKIVEKNGKLYFTIDGVNQTNGLNELDGEYYYANSNGTLAVNTVVYMSKFNDLIAPGNGYFAFDGEGKLIKTGFVKGTNGYTYYYEDLVRAKGFTKLGDTYYFFNNGSGSMQCDATLWVGGDNPYGIRSGYYYFQADGTMYEPDPNGERKVVEKNGKLYFTIDGVNQTNGLNELNGEYYYANPNGTLAVNTVVYMTKFNDLIAPGNGYFAFDGEGKLIKTGFVKGTNGYTYYYNDLVRAKGFTKLGEDYYFFNNGSGAMQCDVTLWVGGSNPYGIVGGYYYFQADGTMYEPDPNGERKVVEKNGKLYFTIDGVNQTNGLNELDGEYYYANSNGTLAVNTVVYMSNFNDLIAPGNGYFAFDGEGKLIKTGFVKGTNGYTYYYEDLVRAKGFTKLGDDYYFFNNGSGAMQCDKAQWVSGSNPYGISGGTYYFGSDGKMVTE